MHNQEQAIERLLTRGVEEVIDKEHVRSRLLHGDSLRVKFGIDPTSPHLHLGHTVPLRKLREFQDLGHTAVLIIGDATAMIGDPTGRSEERNMLSRDEVKKNQKTYLKQALRILDKKHLEVHCNGEWFFPMSAKEYLELASLVTVGQILQREDFKKRLDDQEHPLSVLEIQYPVMQGYDSVMVKADIELGGADQKLNLLMGRRLQAHFGQTKQDIMTVPLIEGTDGVRKMSKSFDNAIFLESEPKEMYGRVMSVPDSLLSRYFTLLTDEPLEEITREIENGKNPRDMKARLAHLIVASLSSDEHAVQAAEQFDRLFKRHEAPEEVPEFVIDQESINIIDVLIGSGFASSKGDARRLIAGAGVKVNERTVEDPEMQVSVGALIQKGKRHFVRIVKK